MQAQRIHLVRHGEVDNPDGILYGRMPGFGLSERGHRMAKLTADHLASRDLPVGSIVVSPLQRAQESAEPVVSAFEIDPIIEPRVIEPWNVFEGKRVGGRDGAWRRPAEWPKLARPWVPSWGEPFNEIVARMRSALLEHAIAVNGADVIVVTHQLPIWMVHRSVAGKPLPHNPASRRCSLSSVTSFEYHPATGLVEVDYREPAASELQAAEDKGAV